MRERLVFIVLDGHRLESVLISAIMGITNVAPFDKI